MITPLRRRALRAAVLALFTAMLAAPVAATPGNRIQVDIFTIALDVEHGIVIFWNISRDDFCAWEASGFDGPPPVTQLISAHEHLVRDEILMVTWGGTSTVELWQHDADADFSGPCQDTDGQSGPWATGTATHMGHDNDVFVSLTRTNAFGDQGRGRVVDVEGTTWQISGHFKARIDRDGEFYLLTEQFNLSRGR